jgi:anti-anti-sigma regulatory factor
LAWGGAAPPSLPIVSLDCRSAVIAGASGTAVDRITTIGDAGCPKARTLVLSPSDDFTDALRHLGIESPSVPKGSEMAPKAPPRPAVLQRATIDKEQRIDLVDVEGELGAAAVTRWTALLQGSIKKGVTGIAVDLRGCRAVDPLCVSAMAAASAILRSRGGGGVKLVTNPWSRLGRRMRTDAPDGLPLYTSAQGALLSFSEAG